MPQKVAMPKTTIAATIPSKTQSNFLKKEGRDMRGFYNRFWGNTNCRDPSPISPIWASRYKYIEIFDILLLIKNWDVAEPRGLPRGVAEGVRFFITENEKISMRFV